MKPLLLSIHVVAGILFVGPVAVATSLFPRYAATGGETAQLLHRITRGYGALALAVPVAGLALAVAQGRVTEVWIFVAMVLTAIAGAILILRISPLQRDALVRPGGSTQRRTLGLLAGVFNLLWLAVVVLMVVRPGSRYA